MSELVKYAILDTDFVSKANIICSNGCMLADEVLRFPHYKFACHLKMMEELNYHNVGAGRWLQTRIETGEIICVDDRAIIESLKEEVGESCFLYYRSFLNEGCNIISNDFYSQYFNDLDTWIEVGNSDKDMDEFLALLQICESSIGHGNSYGEVKAFVLLKYLKMTQESQVIVFCSDDRGARRGFANLSMSPCISLLAVFYKLWRMGTSYEIADGYYQSFVNWCLRRANPQNTVRVWNYTEGTEKLIKTSIQDVLNDIYDGKYEVRKDGDLQMTRR
ncbi:hypothetical protein SAMN04487831_11748 [Pseudobutyrivibrio sp. UC1225]|uniref:hypothetical protein n=1 Tax=Pseudobutyrivibrio sp. UC1225 TaxID=1798185 RepID=UPI0008E97449|nr:hypothetical protein [Pseudobutyrivibrio sp. UC1225]SFO30015.1 hypothetical protein SAMN04487831_11748 [Pseudobutyrivibrio sp. UC1225]